MKLANFVKNRIDAMSYSELLDIWRHTPLGDEMFKGETGKHFHDIMIVRKDELPHEEQVRISKLIGW